MLGPVIQDLSGYIKEFTAGDEFSNIIADFKGFVDDFIADFKELGIFGMFEEYIMSPLKDAMKDIPAMIKKLLFGSEGDPKKKAELEAKKKTLQMQMTGAGPNDIKNISEEIAKLDEVIAATSETTGVFSDVFSDLPWGKIALGIGLVLGAVVAAGYAATGAVPGLAAVGGALTGIGIAAGGIGVLLFGISSVMDSVGENAEEIGHIIDRVFAGIQGTIESVLGEIKGIVGTVFTGVQGTIESVGIAIERVFDSIGGAVAAPIEAIGGVIDKYRELKEAGKDNSAENIALLADIPAGRISGIADEILVLNKSLSGIDSGFSFGAMLGGDEFSSQVQALAGLGNLGDIDFKVTADGVKDLVKFTEDLDAGAVRRYTDAMENLVEVLEKLNEEMEGQATGTGNTQGGSTSPAGAALSAMTSGVGSSDKLDELNNTMKQVLLVLQEQYGVGKRTLKATKQGGNVF